MPASSLLALLDDIATVLDDIAVMTKAAAKKSAGVLGDDLALNAQQVTGVRASRELPVVWAVAKGSLVNKAILVPAALAISVILPKAVIVLLMMGGAFLCFEGFEKVFHKLFHHDEDKGKGDERTAEEAAEDALRHMEVEKTKVSGAIRTDFILSAEIIVITLGLVDEKPFAVRLGVLVAIALLMTVGVYGLVAGVVKLDDAGMALSKSENKAAAALGRGILAGAPWFMRFLGIAGTAAMFLVGGGILVHNVPFFHHLSQNLSGGLAEPWQTLVSMSFDGVVGIILGGLVLAFVHYCGPSIGRVLKPLIASLGAQVKKLRGQ